MNTDEIQRAEQFVKAVSALAEILRTFSVEAVADGLKADCHESAVNLYLERNKAWGKVFHAMSDDMEAHVKRLDFAKDQCDQSLALLKSAAHLSNSFQFKEGMDRLEKFVGLLKELKELSESGFLRDVLLTVNRA